MDEIVKSNDRRNGIENFFLLRERCVSFCLSENVTSVSRLSRQKELKE